MATKKGLSIEKISSNDLLETMGNAKTQNSTRPEPEGGPVEQGAPDKKNKTLITAKIQAQTVKEWKQFCIEHDISLTAAIKKAMGHYIKDVNNGLIEG